QGFDTLDGPMMICAGNDRLFAKLASVMGHPEWCDDERFETNRQRLKNREAIVSAIQNILAAEPRALWVSRLEAAGVPVAPINTIQEALEEPQVQEIDMLRQVNGADFVLAGLPLSFDTIRPEVTGPAPRLGEHTAAILRSLS
ncbi:MAG TPA: CoA transferase, partial [Advenella sp.]|nr:CoA transferase [Advenella sp.]